jgi:hypothetical protein
VRLSERKGGYQITVFTSPTPLRAGPVDISVFVRDAVTDEPIAECDIVVRATPRGFPDDAIQQPATTAAATNKLFQAAVFDLPASGWWDVAVRIDGPREPVEVSFEMEADEPLPRVWEMAPWIVWPIGAILLFLVHKRFVWLKSRRVLDNTNQIRHCE